MKIIGRHLFSFLDPKPLFGGILSSSLNLDYLRLVGGEWHNSLTLPPGCHVNYSRQVAKAYVCDLTLPLSDSCQKTGIECLLFTDLSLLIVVFALAGQHGKLITHCLMHLQYLEWWRRPEQCSRACEETSMNLLYRLIQIGLMF